jgi:hypothetical protein
MSEKSGDGLATAVKFWPTPTVMDFAEIDRELFLDHNGRTYAIAKRSGLKAMGNLRDEVKMRLPTPRANDGPAAGNSATPSTQKRLIQGKARLSEYVLETEKRLPTPMNRDWRSGKASQETMDRNSSPLSEVVHHRELLMDSDFQQISGSLNPEFVEWLMGYPLGWTDLKASETQSSRKSPTKSRKRSSKQKV